MRNLAKGDLVILKIESSDYRPVFLNVPIFSPVSGPKFTVDCGTIVLTRKRLPEVEQILIGSLPNGDTLVRTTIHNDTGKDFFFRNVAITFEEHPRGMQCACLVYIPSPRYEIQSQLQVVSASPGGLELSGKADTQLPSKDTLSVIATGKYSNDVCSCTSHLELQFSVDLTSGKDSALTVEIRMPRQFDLHIAAEPTHSSRMNRDYPTTHSVVVADATSWWIDLVTSEGDTVTGKAVSP